MVIEEAQNKMEKAYDHFLDELAKIRGNRANPHLIEDINATAYGSKVPIKQLGTVSVVDPTLMTVSCWDKSVVEDVKKAIEDADIGVNPSVDGTVVRIPLPPLTEERREELVKLAKRISEEVRIQLRHIRREFLDSLEEDGVSEDEQERGERGVQKLIDEFNEKTNKEFENKEKELMTI